MTTKLEGPLKRALAIGGEPYVLTISPDGLTLVPKGRRKGYVLAWDAFVSGEAALATALNASLMVAPIKSRAADEQKSRASEKRAPAKPSATKGSSTQPSSAKRSATMPSPTKPPRKR
jgi:hypothetical protein